jgi:tetratricopeptide (TPR) repeat protein
VATNRGADATPLAKNSSREEFASVEFRKLLGRFIDVCQAIEYAHSRGVLHRDLKPGNIMLGKYGETLVVDWGLAKAAGKDDRFADSEEATFVPSSGSGVEQTQQGSVVGTPSYMSPEQAAGKLDQLGPTTDVYSLGATLYHLLTGQPPFTAPPRRMGATNAPAPPRQSMTELLRRVQHGEFTRPREIISHIPKPLEAVCLKAMSLRPEGRYASSSAVAEDIEHWLADEPVIAHHEGTLAQATRWVRKHRAWAMSGAAALAIVAIVATIAALVINGQKLIIARQERAATQMSNRNAALAEQEKSARELADANGLRANEESQRTLKSLETVVRVMRLGEMTTSGSGNLELAKQLLKEGLESSNALAKRNPQNQRYPVDQTFAYERLGIIAMQEAKPDEARIYFSSMLETTRAMLALNPEDSEMQRSHAFSSYRLGDVALQLKQPLEAVKYYDECLAIYQRRSESRPKDLEAVRDVAVCLMQRSTAAKEAKQIDLAQRDAEDALAGYRNLVALDSAYPFAKRDLAISLSRLASLERVSQPEKSLASYTEALNIAESLIVADPNFTTYQTDAAAYNEDIAHCHRILGDYATALDYFRRSLKRYRSLADANPKNVSWLLDCMALHGQVARTLRNLGRFADSVKEFDTALSIGKDMLGRGVPATERRMSGVPRFEKDRISSLKSAELVDNLEAILSQPPDKRVAFLLDRARHLQNSGNHALVAETADKLSQQEDPDGGTFYDSACIFSLAAETLLTKRKLPDLNDAERAIWNTYAQQALQMLQRAEAKGYFTSNQRIQLLQTDHDLDSVRHHESIRTMTERLKKLGEFNSFIDQVREFVKPRPIEKDKQ